MDLADLKRKSVRGGMVTMASQGISIAIQLASTVILARLLSPDDYGIMAMVMAVTAFAGLFRDLGLSSAAIQKKNLTDAQQSNLFWLNVAMGSLLTLLVAAASPLVAWFYDKPELTVVTVALSASFLIGSLGTQHGARLVREMQFGRQAAATITGSLVALALSIALALQGLAYWALVWSNLAGAVTTTALLFFLSPFHPRWFRMGAGIRDMLGFGVNVTAFDMVNYFNRNLDNVLIGKFAGPFELGFYSRAYSLLIFPINAIRGPILNVAFPALSKLQADASAYRAYYRGLVSILGLLTIPLMGFIILAAEPIILFLLGPQWKPVAPLLGAMGIAGMIQPTVSTVGTVSLSLANTRRYFVLGTFHSVIAVAGFIIGVRWGALGVAVSYAVTNLITAPVLLHYTFRGTPVATRDFLKAILPSAAITLPAMALAYLVGRSLRFSIPLYDLLLLAAAYALPCAAAVLLIPSMRRAIQTTLLSAKAWIRR